MWTYLLRLNLDPFARLPRDLRRGNDLAANTLLGQQSIESVPGRAGLVRAVQPLEGPKSLQHLQQPRVAPGNPLQESRLRTAFLGDCDRDDDVGSGPGFEGFLAEGAVSISGNPDPSLAELATLTPVGAQREGNAAGTAWRPDRNRSPSLPKSTRAASTERLSNDKA